MFGRIMALVVAVVLLLTGVLSGIGLYTMVSTQTAARQESLRAEAREIAYLASMYTGSSKVSGIASAFLGSTATNSVTLKYLRWKAQTVYEEYGAYIAIVDRTGSMMDNMAMTYETNPDFAKTLNGKDIYNALLEILSGNEISLRNQVDGNWYFTIGVPFVSNGLVLGAVFMQTPAQEIEVRAGSLLLPVITVALGLCLMAGVVLMVCLRRMLKPLTTLSDAAMAMSEGDFTVRAPQQKKSACAEIAKLSDSFNNMAEKLSQLESSRREFVANVSHELKSPITAISGYIEGMRDGTIGEEEYGRYLTIVADETSRLKNLIGDLLKLSRLERDDASLTMGDFDICELLSRVLIHRTGDLENKRMDVECDFDPEPCMVHADEGKIEQVAVNLLDNAIKFTPDGGQIRMSVRADSGICTVIVQDNGVGVTAEDRPHIFERFYTADKAHTSGKGTGLGLSICQRIIEMHGQKLELMDTGSEDGAAFMFTLVLSEKGK